MSPSSGSLDVSERSEDISSPVISELRVISLTRARGALRSVTGFVTFVTVSASLSSRASVMPSPVTRDALLRSR